ncbi:MAG: flippase, partial [bacterium]|nr:flippase [bacterium]
FWLLLYRARLPLSLRPDWSIMKSLFTMALPFMGAAIFSRIYTFSDTAIIAKIAGDQDAGWYSAGNKIILALNMVPASLSTSLFPVMSAYFVHSPEKIGKLYTRALTYLFFIALPMAVGIAVLAKPIVLTLYASAYLPTIGILQVLSLSVLFGFLIYPPGSVLAAVNRQKVNTVIYGIAAAINIGVNILFIPSLGALGSAIASALSNAFIVVVSLFMTRSYWVECWRELAGSASKISFSAIGMGVTVFIMDGKLPLFFSILLGATVYSGLIVALRVFPKEEYRHFYRSLVRKV